MEPFSATSNRTYSDAIAGTVDSSSLPERQSWRAPELHSAPSTFPDRTAFDDDGDATDAGCGETSEATGDPRTVLNVRPLLSVDTSDSSDGLAADSGHPFAHIVADGVAPVVDAATAVVVEPMKHAPLAD